MRLSIGVCCAAAAALLDAVYDLQSNEIKTRSHAHRPTNDVPAAGMQHRLNLYRLGHRG